jgi:hypothetical protein
MLFTYGDTVKKCEYEGCTGEDIQIEYTPELLKRIIKDFIDKDKKQPPARKPLLTKAYLRRLPNGEFSTFIGPVM